MKEVLLSVLINAQRDDVEHTGFGDLANPGDSLFDGGPPKVMSDQWEWPLPRQTLHERLGEVFFACAPPELALQIRDDLF
jgi:hypothetical protein